MNRGDTIQTGDITGSYAAIGAGASILVANVQQSLSAIDEREKDIQAAERRLAAGIQHKLQRYADLPKLVAASDLSANPYKALLDYKLEDAPLFYGREKALAALHGRLMRSKLTVLHSESGSGKTSLLQAGLAAKLLTEGNFPLYLRPYKESPGLAIRRAFLPDLEVQEELARFRPAQMSLRGFLDIVCQTLGGRCVFLLLDQFEEFFSELRQEEQQIFAGELRECLESDLPVWWLLSVRKEYFSDLRLFAQLNPFENEFFLPAFDLEEACDVITEPADRRGVKFEEGLINRILADLRTNDGLIPPPQVQLVCYTLFDERAENDITCALYDTSRGRTGAPGAAGILSDHLNHVLRRNLTLEQRPIASRILETLVTSDQRRTMVRYGHILTELRPDLTEDVDEVLGILVNSRLLRVDQDDYEEPLYELAHDYLLTEIYLDPETQARKAAAELLTREVEAYKRFGTLLSKERFEIINSQRAQLKLDDESEDLLNESQTKLEASGRRRLIITGGAAIFFLILAALAGSFAILTSRFANESQENLATANVALAVADQARGTAEAEATRAFLSATEAETRAKEARSRQLIAEADLLGESDLMRSYLLSIEAGRLTNTAEIYRSIDRIIPRLAIPLLTIDGGSWVNGAIWNSNESLILGWSKNGAVGVWDATTGKPLFKLIHDGEVFGADWNYDESRILTWSTDGTARVWDSSGNALFTLTHSGAVTKADWSSVGDRIITSSEDGSVSIWDAETAYEVVKLEHDDKVLGATWNSDESRILTWSMDGTVGVWDALSGKRLLTLNHELDILGASWSVDDSRILSWGNDKKVKAWDAITGQVLLNFSLEDQPRGAIWNKEETQILTWSGRNVQVWNGITGALLFTRNHNHRVIRANWSHDESQILSNSGDGTAVLWDATTGDRIVTLAQDGWIFGASWNFKKGQIVTWGENATAIIWDAITGEKLFELIHEGSAWGAIWNSDSTKILSWSGSGILYVWNMDKNVALLNLDHGGLISDAFWNSDESRIISRSSRMVGVWDANTNKRILTLEHDEFVTGVKLNRDESRILTWSRNYDLNNNKSQQLNTAFVWDAISGELLFRLTHNGLVNGASWNSDGSVILTWSEDGTVCMWDASNGKRILTFTTEMRVISAAWNADESQVLGLSNFKGGSSPYKSLLAIWDSFTGNLIVEIPTENRINSVTWDAEGRHVLAQGPQSVEVWDTKGVRILSVHHDDTILGALWSNDETRILTWGMDGNAIVWNATSGEEIIRLTQDVGLGGAAWNKDESLILTWGWDNVAYIWDAETGNKLLSLAHDRVVMDATWNSDDTILLTIATGIKSGESLATIWDAVEGKKLQVYKGDLDGFFEAKWNHDESQIMLATHSGQITRYYTNLDKFLAAACQRVTRNLDWQEWQFYFPQEPYRCTCPNRPIHYSVLQSPDAIINEQSICAKE